MDTMDKLLCKLLRGQLQSIGLFSKEKFVLSDLNANIKQYDLYNRWIEESVSVLEQNNYLSRDGKYYNVLDTTPSDMDALWSEWDEQKSLWMKDMDKKVKVRLVEATLKALPDILTGKVSATEIIFPNASMELVEGIYKNNPVADLYNDIVAEAIIDYIQERINQDSSTGIRMIEVGAGTGGTSAMIFRRIQPYREYIKEYCYTDISRAFLLYAQKEYGPQNPYLTYKIFNAEAEILGQGITPGGYDIAIAANVLHATKNIRRTLQNVKATLSKNGLLILNEISSKSLFTHLTFGLLEGWWLYEDREIRIPGCPGLYPETWQKVLESEGFKSVFFPTQEMQDMGQQVIVAESGDVVSR